MPAFWPWISEVDAIPGALVITFGVKSDQGLQDDAKRREMDEIFFS